MVREFFRKSGESGLDHIAEQVQSMVPSCHTTFIDSTAAVFGDVTAASVESRVREIDQSINLAEQEVRRLLVVHASVRAGQDSGLLLAYMNVVKDLERAASSGRPTATTTPFTRTGSARTSRCAPLPNESVAPSGRERQDPAAASHRAYASQKPVVVGRVRQVHQDDVGRPTVSCASHAGL